MSKYEDELRRLVIPSVEILKSEKDTDEQEQFENDKRMLQFVMNTVKSMRTNERKFVTYEIISDRVKRILQENGYKIESFPKTDWLAEFTRISW